VCWWPYEESVTTGAYYDDHINNFNNGKCDAWNGIMLMVNTNSNKFGFKSSEDNGHVFYNFRMEKINGNYYFSEKAPEEKNVPYWHYVSGSPIIYENAEIPLKINIRC
jgi:hypothetical protein